jgi:hypothetical protein
MTGSVLDAQTVVRPERFSSLARFYAADERRLRSRELDVGLWWREQAEGPLHRAAWVADTGELYLVQLGEPAAGGGEVELLANVPHRERLETLLEGWRERCGEPESLGWLRRRSALTRRGSGGSAPGRPRESAPRRRPSPRTDGSADGCLDRRRALPGAPPPADLPTDRR